MCRWSAPPEASTPNDHPDGEQESDNTVIIADRKGAAFRDTLLSMLRSWRIDFAKCLTFV